MESAASFRLAPKSPLLPSGYEEYLLDQPFQADLAGYGRVRYTASTMAKLATLDDDGWELECGEERHAEAPQTFWIPDAADRESLKPDQLVKLMFRIALSAADGTEREETERMWVQVRGRVGELYRGELDNDPYCTDGIRAGMEVFFQPRHVIAIYEA